MFKINDATFRLTLQGKIQEGVKDCACLENAAQEFTNIMYQEFQDAIVLVRLFATVPFGELPAANRRFVTNLAASAGIPSLIQDQTLVLSLLGTRGEKYAWNNRHHSEGHVGIPLASGTFIESIPMMSRLLKELGLGLDWIDSQDTQIVTKTMGKMGGVFYVSDAATTTDYKRRKIIAAQDFVAAHNVKTVFGIGGGYMFTNTFVVAIVFTRQRMEKHQTEQFLSVINVFKTNTMDLVSKNKIFAQ